MLYKIHPNFLSNSILSDTWNIDVSHLKSYNMLDSSLKPFTMNGNHQENLAKYLTGYWVEARFRGFDFKLNLITPYLQDVVNPDDYFTQYPITYQDLDNDVKHLIRELKRRKELKKLAETKNFNHPYHHPYFYITGNGNNK